jgi:hypothetical protein
MSIFTKALEFFLHPAAKDVGKASISAAEHPEMIVKVKGFQQQIDSKVAQARAHMDKAHAILDHYKSTVTSAETAVTDARSQISKIGSHGPVNFRDESQRAADGLSSDPRLSTKTRDNLANVGSQSHTAMGQISSASASSLNESEKLLYEAGHIDLHNANLDLDTSRIHATSDEHRSLLAAHQDLDTRAGRVYGDIFGSHADY